MNKKTVIFDLDGTLADIDIRRNKSLKPNGKLDWDIFAAPKSILDWDKPNPPVIKMAQMFKADGFKVVIFSGCLLYTSPSPRDATLSRMPSSA